MCREFVQLSQAGCDRRCLCIAAGLYLSARMCTIVKVCAAAHVQALRCKGCCNGLVDWCTDTMLTDLKRFAYVLAAAGDTGGATEPNGSPSELQLQGLH